MTSALTSPFHGLPIEEAVPLSMEVKGVSKSSLLQGRRRIRFQPQSGTTATAGNIVQFVLSDSTGLLDVNSMVLSATVDTAGGDGTAPVVLDDGPAWCRRAQLSLNGSLVEDVDNAHRAFNLEIQSTCGQDFYNSEGSFMNLWKFNNTLVSSGSPWAKNNVLASAAARGADTYKDASGNLLNGVQCAWPLGLILPSLRSNKYFPLRSMGEMVLQFTCANNEEAIFSPAQTSNGTVSYQLKNIFLECDIVVPHPSYSSLLDHVTQMESEPGLTIPVESVIVSQGQSISASPTSFSESSVVTSRATTNLRQIIYAVQPRDALSVATYPSVSCFPDAGFGSIQWRIGSLYFPSQPADTLARAAMTTYAAFGEPASTDKTSVWNSQNYDTTSVPGIGIFVSRPDAGGATAPPVRTTNRFNYSDFAPKAYCFDSYKNTSDPLDADGVSILGQAGSQIVSVVRHASPVDITPTIVLKATKYLHLKNGGLRVIGA